MGKQRAEDVAFAHPVERELARILDEHGIEWQYEDSNRRLKPTG